MLNELLKVTVFVSCKTNSRLADIKSWVFLLIYWVTLLNKICTFQEYKSLIHHLYIALYAHHPKSNLPPSPHSSLSLPFTSPHPPG